MIAGVALSAFTFVASEGRAATMGFDDLPFFTLDPVYVENGVTARALNGDLGSFGSGGAHLDDSGSSLTSAIDFTMSRLFAPISFDLFALRTAYCADDNDVTCDSPYDNVLVQGFLNGAETFSDTFFAGAPGVLSTYDFASAAPIDTLRISAVLPDPARFGGFCIDAPCGHFEIDDVTLAPVPVPPALPLLMAAVALIAGVRRFGAARTA